MSAEHDRALSRVAYYEAAIEEARLRGERTEVLEERLMAAVIFAELNEL